MKFTWRTEWPLWALLAVMFALAAITWQHAPDRIPSHWDVNGEVNGYGGKFEGLLLVPLLALAIYISFLVLPRLDPSRANYEHFPGAYTRIRFSVLMVLAVGYGTIHLWIRGVRAPVGTLLPMAVGAMFLVLASVMRKLRPNWFVGIRTPWTLSSERSWTKTHRAAGWIFAALGCSLIVEGVFHSEPILIGTIVLAVVGILGIIVYSYLVWRDDPGRIRPPGTLPAE